MCVVANKPAVVKCAMCAGHGCEPTITPAGKLELVGCWWCEGTGEIEAAEPIADCVVCGRERMAVADGTGGHEGYCPSCTRFEVAD